MTQRSMFFDSSSGDRIYTSDSWAQIFGRVFSDGVVSGYASGMAVTQNGPAAMNVLVPLGSCWVQGRFLDVYSASETLTVLTSDPTNPRIDRVVARIDYTGRTLSLAVLKGTAAATPTAPALTQNTTTWEMSLAQIRVNAGATSIVSANITDERTFITSAAAVAFGKVVVGATTILSTTAADSLNMVAGSNISLTPNAGTKTVTVAVAGGSGSGLNADTLDGIDSSGFSLVTHNHDTRYVLKAGDTGMQNVLEISASASTSGSFLILADILATTPAPQVVFRTDAGGVHDRHIAASGLDILALTAPGGVTINGVAAATTASTVAAATTAANATRVGGALLTAASTAPASPTTGDIWIDTSIVL